MWRSPQHRDIVGEKSERAGDSISKVESRPLRLQLVRRHGVFPGGSGKGWRGARSKDSSTGGSGSWTRRTWKRCSGIRDGLAGTTLSGPGLTAKPMKPGSAPKSECFQSKLSKRSLTESRPSGPGQSARGPMRQRAERMFVCGARPRGKAYEPLWRPRTFAPNLRMRSRTNGPRSPIFFPYGNFFSHIGPHESHTQHIFRLKVPRIALARFLLN
jgi:hypothetical protein